MPMMFAGPESGRIGDFPDSTLILRSYGDHVTADAVSAVEAAV